MKISVVMPAYNEVNTIRQIIEKVMASPYEKELIVIDDGSNDGTQDVLKKIEHPQIQILYHTHNQGKGAALRTGFSKVQGDVVIIQDADLEYDPQEYFLLVEPIQNDIADVVYGSRFRFHGGNRVLFFKHMVGNKLLTFFSNLFTDIALTDMETCYKAFRREVIEKITIEEDGFGVEPEITARVAKLRARVYEVGISYYGRDYSEGKKITWKDGAWALWCIIKYNLFRTDPQEKNLELLRGLDKYNEWIFKKNKSYIGKRILEIGSGIGNFSSFYKNYDKLILTDIEDKYVNLLKAKYANRDNVVIKHYDLNENPPEELAKEHVDTILCINVLEHIENDDKVLSDFYTLLEKDGKLILLVPAFDFLFGAVDRIVHHKRRYRRKILNEKVQKAGFQITESGYLNLFGTFGWFINTCLLQRKIFPKNQLRIFNIITPLLIKLEQQVKVPFGLSVMLVAKRA